MKGNIINICFQVFILINTVSIIKSNFFFKRKLLSCGGGLYLKDNSCISCKAGTYSPNGKNECYKCKAGTYSSQGASQCTKLMSEHIHEKVQNHAQNVQQEQVQQKVLQNVLLAQQGHIPR